MFNRRLLRIAHRGGACLAPENTLAAFRSALTLPVDAIECDIQMSRDGQPIVFHDNTVERVTDGRGNILDLDFAYLRSLNAAVHFPGGWPAVERIPTLREVLDLARKRLQVVVEVKLGKRDGQHVRYPGIVDAVVKELRDTEMLNEALVISFDWPVLIEIKNQEPRVHTGMLVSRELWDPSAPRALDQLIKKARSLGVEVINIDYKLFNEEMPELLHAYRFKLGLWTVDAVEELRHFAAMGVDALTTDRPDLFEVL